MYFSASIGKGFHIWRQRFPDGVPDQITTGPTEEGGIAFAPDGRSFVTSVGSSQSTLWIHDRRGERQVTAQGHPALPSFSADGNTLYYLSSFSSHNMVSGNGELWAANLTNGQVGRLLPGFRMSADGSRVVFVRRDDTGSSSIWLAGLDGARAPRQLTALDSITSFFSANGDVFFVGGEGFTKFLYRIKEDGSGLEKVTEDPVTLLYDVSPDGKWLAAWVGRAVVVYPAEGGAPVLICSACANRAPPDQPGVVTWSGDGKFLYLHDTQLRRTHGVPLRSGEAFRRSLLRDCHHQWSRPVGRERS